VRHSPTLYGVAFYPELYWDGRAKGLEAQILAAWKGQMGADPDTIAKDLEAIPAYRAAFEKELGGPPTGDRIVKALATFLRTLHAGNTPWDRLSSKDQEKGAVGRGFHVFSKVAQCTLCHLPPMYSDGLFHNVGVGMTAEKPDLGRGKILADAAAKANQPAPADATTLQGAFKTPTLRGATLSGPYFHDGGVKTFEEAVDKMIAGGTANPHLDEKLKPAKLSAKERADLLAFLKALTPDNRPYPRPTLP
jgi:cytochrome c peroxidase